MPLMNNNFFQTTAYVWTHHALGKLRQYGLSQNRIKRIVRYPVRVEEGIADNTVAFMQPTSYKTKEGVRTWSQELWVMARTVSSPDTKEKTMRIISAWRYPGITKPGAPLPDAVQMEIDEALGESEES